jgi:hypothetical protein
MAAVVLARGVDGSGGGGTSEGAVGEGEGEGWGIIQIRACSVSSQSMWIEWDWMGLKPKQVKPLLIFFQSHPIHVFWE